MESSDLLKSSNLQLSQIERNELVRRASAKIEMDRFLVSNVELKPSYIQKVESKPQFNLVENV